MRMEKLKVVGLKEHQHELIKAMHKQGDLHIVDIRDKLEEEEWKELATVSETYHLSREITPLIIKLDRIQDVIPQLHPGKK